ncbi:MAG: prepilin-type N-terminal cleavage/methylation domain-containing protein [Acidobacteriota bacterium]
MRATSSRGFSLIETIIALGILTTGVLGAAAVLATGMNHLSSSPSDVVVTQKAAEAIEAVFSARDKLPWSTLRNKADGGIFHDGPQSLTRPGPDGLVNTDDDTTVETVRLPGPDQTLATGDDQIIELSTFTRDIRITDVAGQNGLLRMIVVVVTYKSGPAIRSYTLTSFISSYS